MLDLGATTRPLKINVFEEELEAALRLKRLRDEVAVMELCYRHGQARRPGSGPPQERRGYPDRVPYPVTRPPQGATLDYLQLTGRVRSNLIQGYFRRVADGRAISSRFYVARACSKSREIRKLKHHPWPMRAYSGLIEDLEIECLATHVEDYEKSTIEMSLLPTKA